MDGMEGDGYLYDAIILEEPASEDAVVAACIGRGSLPLAIAEKGYVADGGLCDEGVVVEDDICVENGGERREVCA